MLQEPSPPLAHRRLRNDQPRRDRPVVLARGTGPHDPRPLRRPLGHGGQAGHAVQCRASRTANRRLRAADREDDASPFDQALTKLDDIPSINRRAVQSILAETGVDMSRFPSAHHLASWAGLCPGNNESAGKRRSGRCRDGNRWLCATLVQCAWAASRTRASYFDQQYITASKSHADTSAR